MRKLMVFDPDVVYTGFPHYPLWYAWFYQMLRKRRIARIAHLHGDWWSEFQSWLRTASGFDRLFAVHRYYFSYTGLALADVIAPVSHALQQIVLRHFPSKTTVQIHGTVDPDTFYQEPGPTLEHPNACIIQNHIIWPKVSGLLQLESVVKAMPDVHFYIAGGQRPNQSYTALVQRNFAPYPNAHMLEPLDYPRGVRQLLSETDLYLLASGLDMCPTSVLEASLMEKPVVASRVGGVPEIVIEGYTGYTLPNGDANSWIRTIRSVLTDKTLARRLGRNGRRWVLENFTPAETALHLLEAANLAIESAKEY
jgi:glycosyltransferase involved in cell wall biosynthesis